MRRLSCPLVLAFLLLPVPVTGSGAEAVIHAVQPPAWIERGANSLPARPGNTLRAGDRLRTGRDGRAQVDLPEGSRLKLGAETVFRPTRLVERSDDQGGFIDAALDVPEGEFRFTTGLAGALRRSSVHIRVGSVTASIRGADIWGRSGPEEDLVVLLEGRVDLATDGMAAESVSEPLQGRMLQPGANQLEAAVGITAERMEELSRKTELNDDRGLLQSDGELQIVLASSRYPRGMESIQNRLEAAGYPAYIEAVPMKGRMWHRVVIDNVSDWESGKRLGRDLVGESGVKDFWLRPMNE